MYIVSIDVSFLELPKMQCACVTLTEKLRWTRLRGRLNLFCTFPCGHWIRANIQRGHRKVVCLFKQETSEGVRWPLWKRGRNPMTRQKYSQPASYIYRHPATIASLSSGALLGEGYPALVCLLTFGLMQSSG